MFRQTIRAVSKANRLVGFRTYAEAAAPKATAASDKLRLSIALPHQVSLTFNSLCELKNAFLSISLDVYAF